MTEVGQMTQRDYLEAWGWVHLLLNGPEPGKRLLMAYLTPSDRADTKARLRPILADARIDDAGLRAHLSALPYTPVVASKPSASRLAGSLRFQDGPARPGAPAA